MKKKLNKNRVFRLIMGCVTFFCCRSSMISAYQVNFSFDSLFPMTWYQKGLESSLQVWQALINVFEKSDDAATLSFDLLLGRLAFSQFCINRMHKENKSEISEDNVYFKNVLNKIQQLLAVVTITPKTEDFVECAEDMLQVMQQNLQNN